jgi:hypothetical protein
MRPKLIMAAPCVAGAGILLIVNAVISGSGWLVPTGVIAGAGCIMAGIVVLIGRRKTTV